MNYWLWIIKCLMILCDGYFHLKIDDLFLSFCDFWVKIGLLKTCIFYVAIKWGNWMPKRGTCHDCEINYIHFQCWKLSTFKILKFQSDSKVLVFDDVLILRLRVLNGKLPRTEITQESSWELRRTFLGGHENISKKLLTTDFYDF